MMTLPGNDRIEFEKKMQEILDLKNADDFSNAIRKAEALIPEFPEEAPAYGVLGMLYFLTDDYSRACLNFKKTTVLSPKSELASLGLFHSLWHLGDQESALTEMERFTAIADSVEYDTLRKEMEEEGRL